MSIEAILLPLERKVFRKVSKDCEIDVEDSIEFARKLDEEDELKEYRHLFQYPKKKNLPRIDLSKLKSEEDEAIYFCGHSLGLPLKNIDSYLKEVIKNWGERGVHSHTHGFAPAAFCDLPLKEKMAALVGAECDEIAVMNGLTVNIHIMFSSFYKPTPDRYKILMMDQCFHSDRFAVESQVRSRGLDPDKSIIYLKPRDGEEILNLKDILSTIKKHGSEIALVFLEGVNYLTGQMVDMRKITEYAHNQGCIVGFDLAHATGNVKLNLHEWDVDFAVWCTYKYMNCGAGSLSSVFVHNKFTQNGAFLSKDFPMLRGWWGLNLESKFSMNKDFVPANGADCFKLSNPSPFLATMLLANLEVFNEAGIDSLVKKQRKLTGYLEILIRKAFPPRDKMGNEIPHISIISPANPNRRGCMLSLKSSIPINNIQEEFMKWGIVCDVRRSMVIRAAPMPLYNTFEEVHDFVRILKQIFSSITEDLKST